MYFCLNPCKKNIRTNFCSKHWAQRLHFQGSRRVASSRKPNNPPLGIARHGSGRAKESRLICKRAVRVCTSKNQCRKYIQSLSFLGSQLFVVRRAMSGASYIENGKALGPECFPLRGDNSLTSGSMICYFWLLPIRKKC